MLPAGYAELICELLLLTFSDVKMRSKKGGGNFQKRQEALAFLDTEWFDTLCASVDLDSHTVKHCLLQASQSKC